jgi:VWFA-related protein
MRFLRYHRFGTESAFLPTGATDAARTGTPAASEAPPSGEPEPWMEAELPGTREQDDSPVKEPQPAPATAGTGLTIRATAQLVEVPVIVRDKQGNPILDLTKADFEIYDNGRLQDVRLFNHESASEPLKTESPTPAAPKPGRRVFSNLDGSTAHPTSLKVILIDQVATEWPDLAYARQQIIQFLRQLPPGERVGIYTLTGGSIFNILRECTRDDTSMADRLSLGKGGRRPTSGPAGSQEAEADFPLMSWLDGTDRGFRKAQLKETGGNFASPLPNESSMGALIAVARHLAGVPGRKNLIWVSAGFPPGNIDLLAPAIRIFNNANVAIYPVDAAGLQTAEPDATVQPAQDFSVSGGGARVFHQAFANSVSRPCC